MATPKEATVYIVDVGKTMGEKSHGRVQTNLDFAMEYVWDKITTTVATNRKTAMAAVVALRSDETKHTLGEAAEYQHINVLHPISQVLMSDVRKLRNEIAVSQTELGDAISALVIAIQMIKETCKKLKYVRKVVLVTDARAEMDTDDLSQITKEINSDNIELVILGVDFDDADYPFVEDSKDDTKAANEAVLKQLCEDCNGSFGTLAEAIDELEKPRTKSTNPTPSYKGLLTLGNVEQYEDAMSIDVERYPKTSQAPAPSASKFVVRSGAQISTQNSAPSGENGSQDNGDGLSAITRKTNYQIKDEDGIDGKRDVALDDLSKGYEYGRTAVHIAESDQNITLFETKPGLDIVGFVDGKQYHRFLDMSRASMILPQKTNDKASLALSSLIHALFEVDSYAVARFVPRENKEPKMLLLAPNIEREFECLYDVELPFAEDVRSYKFPPLDRVLTVSGKEIKVHRNLPSDDLLDAMSEYVDNMSLVTEPINEDDEPVDSAPIDETFNPKLHRIQQVVKHRAVFPDADPPPPFPIIGKFSHPPEDLVRQAKKALDRVIEIGEVKKVPPKTKGKRWNRKAAPAPLSNLDVAALLAQDPARKAKGRRIDPRNAIPEFKQVFEGQDVDEVKDACKQFGNIIVDWIRHSVGDSKYGQAVEGLLVMREELVEFDEPGIYNDFLDDLKKKLFGGELNGNRELMFYKIRVGKIGLITSEESPMSKVSAEQSKAFMMPPASKSASA